MLKTLKNGPNSPSIRAHKKRDPSIPSASLTWLPSERTGGGRTLAKVLRSMSGILVTCLTNQRAYY
jgi:hypothetical protein